MLSTKTITSNAKDNKNKTNRLTHNKNNTAEAQLTDSFGEALYLGLAPQPGREQQKTVLRQSLNWLDHWIMQHSDQSNPFALGSRLGGSRRQHLVARALNKNKKPKHQ
jgi:hypothetical protein